MRLSPYLSVPLLASLLLLLSLLSLLSGAMPLTLAAK